MTGYHEVRIFWVASSSTLTLKLPVGWKPFAVVNEFDGSGLVGIVARKWNRDEPEA